MKTERAWTEGELALKQFLESQGHELCETCRCCDLMDDHAPCWNCLGYDDEDDFFDKCGVCGGDGELYFKTCIGGCRQPDSDGSGGEPHGKLKNPRVFEEQPKA